jgi:carboxylesterase type B
MDQPLQEFWGLAETCEKRLEKLRSLSPEELMQNCRPNATLPPVADGKLLPTSWRLEELHPNSHCKDIIIGNTRVEAIIFDSLSRHLRQSHFHEKVLAEFTTASDADQFCKYFGFTLSEEQPYEAFRDAMRFFLSVVLYHFPGLRVAESCGGNAYLYHFEEPSPYSGPTHGLPVHGQCAVFAYNNERKVWPESAKRISLEMANLWTAFAYGKEPWQPYPAAKRFMRFGPFRECGMRSFEDDETRDYGYLSWLRRHFEEAKALVQSLM